MKNQSLKKILVSIDGSKRGLDTVRQVANFEPFKSNQVTLFHIFSGLPEYYWDVEKNPTGESFVTYRFSWESERKKKIQDYMNEAKEILLKAGFTQGSVKNKIQKYHKGITRDMIEEAKNGYDAIIFRRRGISRIESLILGSVSTKMSDTINFIPLLLMGKEDIGRKILIALDRSDCALRAVEFLGSLAGGFDYEVCLFNVIRARRKSISSDKDMEYYNEYIRAEEKKVSEVFTHAENRLVDFGFSPSQISTKIISGEESRAAAIVNEANQGNYGTIVMGRTGMSQPTEFSMGRVPKKVIYLARKKSVWIIN